jgi:hypothetical protein
MIILGIFMKNKQELAHTTANELEFVDGMGSSTFPVRQLLRGYIAGAKRRVDWGCVDAAAVIARAEKRLGELG